MSLIWSQPAVFQGTNYRFICSRLLAQITNNNLKHAIPILYYAITTGTYLMTMKLIILLWLCTTLLLTGCSSTMSHTGSNDVQYYPGVHASYHMLISQDAHWTLKPFIIMDMPFTLILDTLLLPWDAMKNNPASIKSRVNDETQITE